MADSLGGAPVVVCNVCDEFEEPVELVLLAFVKLRERFNVLGYFFCSKSSLFSTMASFWEIILLICSCSFSLFWRRKEDDMHHMY